MHRSAIAYVLCAALLLAPAALAQAPSPQAREAGLQWDAAALRAILTAHNTADLFAFEGGFRETAFRRAGKPGGRTPMSPEIEALIVQNYEDPVLRPGLRHFIRSSPATYQSRALFDKLYAYVTDPSKPNDALLYVEIIDTEQPGIDAPLLEYLRTVPITWLDPVRTFAQFFGKRHYTPAVPSLAQRLRQLKPGYGLEVAGGLMEMRDPAATRAVIERIAVLRDMTGDPAAATEIDNLAMGLASQPIEMPLDYAELERALPRLPSNKQKAALLGVASKRKDAAGFDFLLDSLGDERLRPGALRAIIDTDSVDAWKQARARIEQLKVEGKLATSHYRYAADELDWRIADPSKHMAQQREAARTVMLHSRTDALAPLREKARTAQRSGDAAQYVSAYLDYVSREEALAREFSDVPHSNGLKGTVANEYFALGNVVRFKLHDPNRAIELYRAAARNGSPVNIAVADVQQYDLRDKAAAIQTLRGLARPASSPASGNEDEASLQRFAQAWLAHQISWLEDGRTFSGPVNLDDCSGGMLFLTYGLAGSGEFDPLDTARFAPLYSAGFPGARPTPPAEAAKLAAAIPGLPPSTFTLLQTAGLLGALPDAHSILVHLARNDPAGYASACYFAILGQAGAASPALQAAASEFNRAHHVTTVAADARLATPEKTWNLLLASLRAGDGRTALSCFTPAMQEQLRPVFEGSTSAELSEMAGSFTSFALSNSLGDNRWTGYVQRGTQAGEVSFIRVFGEWKIESM